MSERKPAPADLASSAEIFGALLGRLSLPFADRARELAAVGLESDAELARLEAAWADRFKAEGPVAEDLVTRFADAHSAVRESGVSNQTSSNAGSIDPRFLTPEAQPWRSEAAAVSLEVSANAPPLIAPVPLEQTALRSPPPPVIESAEDNPDETCMPRAIFAPVLPFPAGSASAISPLAVASEPRSDPELRSNRDETMELRALMSAPVTPFDKSSAPVKREIDPAEDTAELRAIVLSPATPFSKQSSPASPQADQPRAAPAGAVKRDPSDETVVATSLPSTPPLPFGGGPGKRLIYFDPKTGEKLANPTWVDLPKKPDDA